MRVAAAIGIGLLVVGAALTWATNRVIAGAIVMIVGSLVLLVVVVVWPDRPEAADDAVSGRADRFVS
jgi:hypothetical protein